MINYGLPWITLDNHGLNDIIHIIAWNDFTMDLIGLLVWCFTVLSLGSSRRPSQLGTKYHMAISAGR
jgi:hypothetical protein